MAGKPRKRIDYANWSVDIFSNDTKIDKLLDAQGWVGFGIYFYLCQMAFGSEGYFYEWCYDLCATTARKMGGGVGAGTVKETVDYCLQIGLFDKGLFDRWGVLTSRGIQKSYQVVLKSKKRTGTEIIKEYWLLENEKEEDFQDVVFVRKNGEKVANDGHSLGGNSHSLGGNGDSHGQEYSKVKYSKEEKRKESGAETRFTPPTAEEVKAYCLDKNYSIDADRFVDFYSSKGWMIGKNKMKDWKAAVRNWSRGQKPSSGNTAGKKNGFKNSEERNYDFAALERALVNK